MRHAVVSLISETTDAKVATTTNAAALIDDATRNKDATG